MAHRRDDDHKLDTRHLGPEDAPPMVERTTDPLDLNMPGQLRLVGPDLRAVLDVPLRPHLVVGRRTSVDDYLIDIDLTIFGAFQFGVSRQHALIVRERERLAIKDLESTNGTFLNGCALQPGESYRLRHGDELRLGRLPLQLRFLDMPVTDSIRRQQ